MDFRRLSQAPRPALQAVTTASVKHVSLPAADLKQNRLRILVHRTTKKLSPITHRLQPLFRYLKSSWAWVAKSQAGKFAGKWCTKTWRVARRVVRPIFKNPVTRWVKRWPRIYKRLATGVLALALIAGGYFYAHNLQYKLSAGEQQLLARPSVDLTMIKTTKDAFTYNRTDEQHKDGFDAVAAASQADSSGKFPYQVTLPKNPGKGITFASSDGSLGFTMTPMFTTAGGRMQDGRVLYPEGLNSVHSYTFKRNGVKEDILLSRAPGSDTYTKSWKLELGDKLEAHMLPSGGVGIYSASSLLSGNVTASSPADQKLLDTARKNGKKDNLEFVIPTPYVSYATGSPQYNGVKFALNGNVLTLTVTGMKSRAYPLSIDPTLVVTTTADFQQGTDDDGMIDYSTSGQINRADISYGTPSSLNQQTSAFTTARYLHASVVYNGYLYIIGGRATASATGCDSSGYCNDIQYCPINANGSVGTCTQQLNAFPTTRYGHTAVTYDGYLYILGGIDNTFTYRNEILYCALNSNGSVGTCNYTCNGTNNGSTYCQAFPSGHYLHTSVVYNGYLYVIGGTGTGGPFNNIQYCPIDGDGTVGTCNYTCNGTNNGSTSCAAFTTARIQHSSVASNGYLYIIGGSGASNLSDIQYCPINGNGTIGSCTTNATGFTTARSGQTSVVYNGYLYIIGGWQTGSTYLNDIQYCSLNGNGSVSACTQVSNAFTTTRGSQTTVINNGYLYITGGATGASSTGCTTGASTTWYCSDIQYGLLGKYASTALTAQQTNAFTNARYFHASVVYNGYLYIIGGFNNSIFLNDIAYCLLNSNGSVGACTDQTSAFTTARSDFATVANNGYLYIVGGEATANATGCNASGACNDIQYCPLNTNGSVGTCTQQLSAFTTPRWDHGSVAYNGYLYIVGGFGSTRQNDIQRCPFNSNGSVGACTQQTNAFTTARQTFGLGVYNGYMYIYGGNSAGSATGCDSNGYCNDIQYCPINSNGSVGACTQQLNAFTAARSSLASAVYNGYLYIIGGNTAVNTPLNDIQFCPLNTNGSVGTCTQQLNAYITARTGHTAVVYNGYLYIAGGAQQSGSPQNDIQHVPIIGGLLFSVGATSQQTSMISGRYIQSSVVYNGYLYVIGGTNGSALNDIEHCPLNTNGSVGACTDQTNAFTTGRLGHTSVVYNGYLYIIGGQSFSSATGCTSGSFSTWYCNDIQYCPFNSNGTVGACTQQLAAFANPRTSHSSIVYNGYLYVIGGQTNASSTGCTVGSGSTWYCADIQYCPLNSNGSVGACTQQASAVTAAREGQSSVVYNGYLYIIGGYDGFSYRNDILYCPLNANGSVGTCTQQLGAFTNARGLQTSVVYNGYLYIVAGTNGPNNFSDVIYCPFNANGSVGSCAQQANALANVRWWHSSVVYNGFLYVIAGESANSATGCDINGMCSDIQHLDIADRGFGPAGTTTQQTNAFTGARYSHTSVIYNGYLYIIGGNAGGTLVNDILYCPLNANGSVGSCTDQTNAFTSARSNHTSVAYNGYLYIIGGTTGTDQNDIQYCPFNTNGSVGACTQQTNAFTNVREGHASVIYNGYLYIIGGYSSGVLLSDIQYCPLNANGSVGSCTTNATGFIGARTYLSSVVYNGYLYIIGGISGPYNNDIQYCPLNANGSVGSCTQQLNAFTSPRKEHTSVVYNGYLYIIGGFDGTNYYNDIQYCPINSNGSVGSCIQQTSAFTTARYGHTSVVYNGYLYIIGGFTASLTPQNDIQRLLLTSPDLSSNYEKVMNIGSVAGVVASFIMNGTAACNLRVDYELADGSGVFGSTTTLMNAKVGTTYSINATNQQYVWFKVYMDDSTCGGRTSITDITLTFGFAPSAPALIAPANAAVGTSLTPQFQLRSSDATGVDYARYKIFVCSDSLCNTIIRTIDQTASQTGWTGQDSQAGTAYVTNSVLSSSTIAKHTYQAPALSGGTQYWWEAQAIDPGDTNQWGPLSSINTFTTQSVPAAPTLSTPAAGATGVSTSPVFTLRTTDADGDYLKYKILVCSTSNCSSVVRTIDETASQTGWSGQDQQAGTAYTGNAVITSSTMATYTYQAPALSFSTQYWWEAFAIDPGGSNTFSAASAIQTFTTPTPPNAPTLVAPVNSGTLLAPIFQIVATDPDNDYLKYKFDLCSTSNCSSIITTINQVSSQTGWQDQDQQSATAYSSGRTSRYQWQGTNLTPNTQYWWRAAAIDPAGTNTFGSFSSIGTFTTGQLQSVLRGGSIIRGGTIVR